MAWERIPTSRLARVAAKFRQAGERIEEVLKKATAKELAEVVFQIRTAEKYADHSIIMAADAETHISDQVECLETHGVPLWQQSQTRSALNKARKEAKANLDPAWIKPKPTKKATKKATKRHPKT